MLRVRNIAFSYHKDVTLSEVSFKAAKGEHVAIIGESGSGKSTLLKVLYGEFDLSRGGIFWKKTPILGPKHNLILGYDFMKYVAQEFDLMPYTSVEENIAKHLSRFYPQEMKTRTEELLDVVELQDYKKTKVRFLSGGQKQRVALARALAKEPEILLLDEPFSHIDNFKKQSLRRSLFSYLKKQQVTCLVATHDKDDVIPFSDTIIVLHKGKILAKDTPKSLFQNPKTPLIASFFGEYSLIKEYDLNISSKSRTVIVYAHQLKKVAQSPLKAVVKQSYFKGHYYLIEAYHKDNILYFNHNKSLKPETSVHLKYHKN